MSDFEVSAEKRTDTGKGAMRRLRSTGRVPGVMYGADEAPANITLNANELRKQLENEAFFSHIITVNLAGEAVQAVVKDLQRHPASYQVTHVDFLRVKATDEITMRVPLHFVNEDKAPGKRAGGQFSHLMNDVEITCLPANLPEYLDVDVAALDLGDSIHLSEITLPEGVSFAFDVTDPDHDHTVATVQMPQDLDMGEEEEGEELVSAAEVPTTAETEEEDEDGEDAKQD